MFVWINFLGMIKIGIIGWDKHLQHLTNLVKGMEGFLLTGWMNDSSENNEDPDSSELMAFHSFEAFHRCVDAVAITYKSDETFETICLCLKYFKHVFLLNAQRLKYKDFIYLHKISEESNVRFYPEFGSLIPDANDVPIEGLMGIQFVDLNQTFSPNEGICVDGRLSLALLRDVFFLTSLIGANVKKITANGWGFSELGAGMLNAKIDFDNGTSVNILLANSVKPRQTEIVIYGRCETLRISSIDNITKISRESLTKGQIDCHEKIFPKDSSLRYDLNNFFSSIHNIDSGLRFLEHKYQSFRMTHLIQEKINHFASINIFYS